MSKKEMSPLSIAIAEAERFLVLARALSKERRENPVSEITGTRLSGATRRASLDLTRALTDYRSAGRCNKRHSYIYEEQSE